MNPAKSEVSAPVGQHNAHGVVSAPQTASSSLKLWTLQNEKCVKSTLLTAMYNNPGIYIEYPQIKVIDKFPIADGPIPHSRIVVDMSVVSKGACAKMCPNCPIKRLLAEV